MNVAEIQHDLHELGIDGWLCYDFKGMNPVAARFADMDGMMTRRLFVWVPARGIPQAVVHRIDRNALGAFDGEIVEYTTWQDLHARLETLVKGRRVAMEVSAENAVPYLDRVPAGVVQLIERLGGSVVESAALVTRFAARWSEAERDDHRQAAEALAEIAKTTLGWLIREAGRATELEVQRAVLAAMRDAGLETDDPPIVAFGAHSADPHYAPSTGSNATLAAGDVVLLDLWGRRSAHTVWADQTWMAFAGASPREDVARVWEAVRAARDAVIATLRSEVAVGAVLRGARLDDAAREVLVARGYGDQFTHRTGHSIDLDLHGSGPHLDNFETRDVRELMPGVGFSIEPGVYLPGRFGIRSEVNALLTASGVEVTPAAPQERLIVLLP